MQCKIGAEVIQNGWDGNVQLGQREAAELSWICDNLKAFNGRGIRNENAGPAVWESAGKIFTRSRQQTEAETANWVREHGSQLWIMKIAGQVKTTDAMPCGVHPEAVVRGVDQLQEIQEKLAGQPDRGQEDGWTKVF